ncbi:DUF397 domain-containing protein [Streptomyces sp. H27-C3]|uniref:DUF397 domain-containing protein n=1 Tax=Streptomyces sp. H27-C3 TaxID=3046305 RepID=UPI0024BAD732|nr:DUF397 domain-containing protein [Streptomyces sp. H27-C3]MDJ0461472.1 DUF397 domain-containing protein [Streptomyces sp. H27-C3]
MTGQLQWFKSSYSDDEGANCIEVALEWRKSTYSDDEGGACVEVSTSCPAAIHVRDSKLTAGPELTLPAASWAAFVTYAVRG